MAVATPSDLYIDQTMDYLEENYGLSEDDTLSLILAYVRQISDSLSGPAVASPSEMETSGDYTILADNDISLLADLALPDHDIVLIEGTFGGDPYTLLVPLDVYPSLWVGENNVLYNLSGSSITCRMVEGSAFDPADYLYKNFTLAPVLGNSQNTLYRYHYLSYLTEYYEYGSSLRSDTTYGNFMVTSVEPQSSLNVDYKGYTVALSSFFLLGVIVLCFWKISRH